MTGLSTKAKCSNFLHVAKLSISEKSEILLLVKTKEFKLTICLPICPLIDTRTYPHTQICIDDKNNLQICELGIIYTNESVCVVQAYLSIPLLSIWDCYLARKKWPSTSWGSCQTFLFRYRTSLYCRTCPSALRSSLWQVFCFLFQNTTEENGEWRKWTSDRDRCNRCYI